MCGVAGIFHLDGKPCDPQDLDVFTDSLAHRGPDGRGVFVAGPLGLGHRRLAILDLGERAQQPMSCMGGRYQVTYNGEIFNFLELRKELESFGLCFSTETDTEIIAAAYHHWGADCVFKFNGMWAFGLWDSERRELFLSRDRFGIKPLHYLAEPRRFAFASELKAFLHLRGFTARENAREMHYALARRGESLEDTLLEGVRRLPAGHNMLVGSGGIRKWRWWHTLDHLPTDVPGSLADQAEQFRELFFDSVRLRMRSDVSIASALSGGLDSSSIVCTAAELGRASRVRQTQDCRHAFVATFAGTPWDESSYAEATIERAGVQAHMLPITLESVLENLHRYAYDFEMVGDALLIPLWLTYREIRRHGFAVSLDGHGADEMLAGYSFAFHAELLERGNFLHSPLRTLDLIRTLHGTFTTDAPSMSDLVTNSDPILRANRLAIESGRRRARRLLQPRSRQPRVQSSSIDIPPFVEPWTEPVEKFYEAELEAVTALGPFNASLYKQFHSQPLPSILHKFDRCSMAHGVEIRMPFMDWRLVCYAFALSGESKAGGGYTKRVLREAMHGVLPEKVRTRKPKLGFGSPIASWFNGKLGDWMWSEVQTPAFLQSEAWNGPAIRDFVAMKRRSCPWTFQECSRVWRFLQAHLWRQAFFPD